MTGVLPAFLADRFYYGIGNKFLTAVGGYMSDYHYDGFFNTAVDVALSWHYAGTGASLSCMAFTKVHF